MVGNGPVRSVGFPRLRWLQLGVNARDYLPPIRARRACYFVALVQRRFGQVPHSRRHPPFFFVGARPVTDLPGRGVREALEPRGKASLSRPCVDLVCRGPYDGLELRSLRLLQPSGQPIELLKPRPPALDVVVRLLRPYLCARRENDMTWTSSEQSLYLHKGTPWGCLATLDMLCTRHQCRRDRRTTRSVKLDYAMLPALVATPGRRISAVLGRRSLDVAHRTSLEPTPIGTERIDMIHGRHGRSWRRPVLRAL
jgi:hypothetical protein